MVNPYIIRKSAAPKISKVNKSAGILDDFAVRKNVATKEGTIEHTPTDDNHIANKKYVDDAVAAGGGGFSDPMTTRGDIIYKDSSGTTTRLAAGAASTVLTSDGTDISWAAGGGGETYTGGTNLTLDGTTFNVDDAFIVNNADDTTTGTITAAGFTTSSGNVTITSGDITDGTNATSAAEIKTAYDHSQDNTQAHSDYLINNGNDTTSGTLTAAKLLVTGDNNTNDSEYVPMVLHGTDATPPTASGFPRGTIYIQYTA